MNEPVNYSAMWAEAFQRQLKHRPQPSPSRVIPGQHSALWAAHFRELDLAIQRMKRQDAIMREHSRVQFDADTKRRLYFVKWLVKEGRMSS